jgi:hypothetical protein
MLTAIFSAFLVLDQATKASFAATKVLTLRLSESSICGRYAVQHLFATSCTHHTSHITHHTSHITHHTSHITHHTSHITHHQCLQRSTASSLGHRLILFIDACHSGHWALKAQQLCLTNVVVQTSCSSDQKSVHGIFLRAFVSFQNSGGKMQLGPEHLHACTPFVYVPMSFFAQ